MVLAIIAFSYEKVLHPTIEQAQFDHGLELLGHGRFTTVAAQSRRTVVQNRGELDQFATWKNDVAKTDIDLHRKRHVLQRTAKVDPNTLVVRIFLDDASRNAVGVEGDAVWFHTLTTNISNDVSQSLNTVRHVAQQVYVLGRPTCGRAPHGQHERPLQFEFVGVGRLRKSVQEAFHRKVLQDLLERASRGLCEIQESLPD